MDDPRDVSPELIAAHDPSGRKAEVLRSLRVQLMLGAFNPTANALAIVSPSPREGRSFMAANLGVVFAQLGQRTLLVDAHMQKPRLHEICGTANDSGLSSALGGRTPGVLKAISVPNLRNLWLVPGGPPPPHPDDLLARDAFAALCSSFKSQYDVVLFDTPPGNTSSAADWIADRCGKALVVVRRNHTGFSVAKAFLERINSRAQVVGCVLNRY